MVAFCRAWWSITPTIRSTYFTKRMNWEIIRNYYSRYNIRTSSHIKFIGAKVSKKNMIIIMNVKLIIENLHYWNNCNLKFSWLACDQISIMNMPSAADEYTSIRNECTYALTCMDSCTYINRFVQLWYLLMVYKTHACIR